MKEKILKWYKMKLWTKEMVEKAAETETMPKKAMTKGANKRIARLLFFMRSPP